MPADDLTHDPELVALAGQLLDTLDEFSADLAEHIQARVDFYQTTPAVTSAELRRSCYANAEFVLRSMHDGRTADVTAAQETGRRRADQGVPLAHVMAAFRVGFGRIWTRLVERARRDGRVSSDALVDVASEVWAVHDTFAEAMATAYRDTATAHLLRDERERSALVAALLEGRLLPDSTIWDIAGLLRLPRHGPFVVVAAEPAQLAHEALPHIESRLRARGIGSAWRLLPDLHVGIAHLPDPRRLSGLTSSLADVARGRVGVSPAYQSLAETPHGLRFARIAMASTPSDGSRVTRFDEHPLAVAAVSAPEAMGMIAHSVLRDVLDLPPEQSAVLLRTLAAWRDNGGSATAAGRALFCHPNTIRQRLRKIETLTGRALADPRAAAELLVALQTIQLTTAENP